MAGVQSPVADLGRGAPGKENGLVQKLVLGSGRFGAINGRRVKAVDDMVGSEQSRQGMVGQQGVIIGMGRAAVQAGLKMIRADVEVIDRAAQAMPSERIDKNQKGCIRRISYSRCRDKD
jgi:hypothetical protein